MKLLKTLIHVSSLLICFSVSAAELKVFGREFCNQYNAGSCINFHYDKIKDAKNFLGQYKYPKGRKAYDECAANTSPTDGALAYCSMIFHREEQNEAQRASMCTKDMLDKYWQTISGDYAMGLYLDVWKCKVGK